MGVIEALVVALDSIPPIPGDAIVQCVAGLAVAVFRVYEQKCANDAKVGELHRAIAQVSVVLDKHLVPQRKMVATYRDQLKDLTDALKAAGEWVAKLTRTPWGLRRVRAGYTCTSLARTVRTRGAGPLAPKGRHVLYYWVCLGRAVHTPRTAAPQVGG